MGKEAHCSEGESSSYCLHLNRQERSLLTPQWWGKENNPLTRAAPCWGNVRWWVQGYLLLMVVPGEHKTSKAPAAGRGQGGKCSVRTSPDLSSSKILPKSEHRALGFLFNGNSVTAQLTYEWESWVKETWSGRWPLCFQAYAFTLPGLERRWKSLVQLVLGAFSEGHIHLQLFLAFLSGKTTNSKLGQPLGCDRLCYGLSSVLP